MRLINSAILLSTLLCADERAPVVVTDPDAGWSITSQHVEQVCTHERDDCNTITCCYFGARESTPDGGEVFVTYGESSCMETLLYCPHATPRLVLQLDGGAVRTPDSVSP